MMAKQANAGMIHVSDTLSRTAYIGSVLFLYGIIALGYQSVLSQSSSPLAANTLCFTLCQIAYGIMLWQLPRGKPSARRLGFKIAGLTLLAFACSLLTLTGLALDWQIYLVTIAAFFIVYSPRTALLCTALLYVIPGTIMFALNHWSWSDALANWFNLLSNFAAVAVFLYVLRVIAFQRARAEQLLHQLEHSKAELEQAHQQLQLYAQEVEELTIVRERTRLAREIHDTLGHYLSLLNIQLGTISKLYVGKQTDLTVEIAEARQFAGQAMQEVHHAVAALRPTSVTTLSLAGALAQLGNEFASSNEAIHLTLDLPECSPEISQEVHMAFYRAAQEALTNILKHAQASQVLLRLRYEQSLLALTILDNGTGGAIRSDQQAGGFGLTGLRERFDVFGGQVTYGPEGAGGYRVTVQLRVASQAPGQEQREVAV